MTDGIDPSVPPSGAGCVECERDGSWWVHLRRCAECGHVGCCDDSLARHARAHAAATGHRYIQSFEPSEDWFWDFRTDQYVEGPMLASPTSHPDDQSVPGPASRLPDGWRAILMRRANAETAG
ncbi:UBP-type zinc finger domain-containing protein [Leifsonia sp. McL0607]|uniref:UBP-type zinc finger domain-containing protein n=1 Tax=Leifsonia sp. McL0607 TaxID=3415672 RepID=UPI003CF9675A